MFFVFFIRIANTSRPALLKARVLILPKIGKRHKTPKMQATRKTFHPPAMESALTLPITTTIEPPRTLPRRLKSPRTLQSLRCRRYDGSRAGSVLLQSYLRQRFVLCNKMQSRLRQRWSLCKSLQSSLRRRFVCCHKMQSSLRQRWHDCHEMQSSLRRRWSLCNKMQSSLRRRFVCCHKMQSSLRRRKGNFYEMQTL